MDKKLFSNGLLLTIKSIDKDTLELLKVPGRLSNKIKERHG